jgi:hypothetical protein
MLRRFGNWLLRPIGQPRERRRGRSRLSGCLFWVVILIAVLILLALFFGSFQKGTKASLPAPPAASPLAIR